MDDLQRGITRYVQGTARAIYSGRETKADALKNLSRHHLSWLGVSDSDERVLSFVRRQIEKLPEPKERQNG